MKARAIPTWVGKSIGVSTVFKSKAGHPHVGGEIKLVIRTLGDAGGPSPRGWGNHKNCKECWLETRAIPTWVGKSGFRPQSEIASTGHPHVGGEILTGSFN